MFTLSNHLQDLNARALRHVHKEDSPMFERWQKDFSASKQEYIIDRIHSIATMRVLSPEGYTRTVKDVSKDLITSTRFSKESLEASGYQQIQ